ncbi:alpha/beta fold hydrolase [Neobacillus sp. D3-1R]|uniref:alpha/beta fold hydrolase n=1 Tax=Neobacillus sp. D3-1R TaxID=3445778 RepID=UPI003FA09973
MLTILLILIIFMTMAIVASLIIRKIKQKKVRRTISAIKEVGGISEIDIVEIGGIKQHIVFEGADRKKPVCLFIHGGPGSPFPFGVSSRSIFPDLTENMIAVYFDQRGSGKSYNKNIDIQSMNLEQFISDANEVVDYTRDKMKKDKIYIVGNSFGTIVGTELAYRYPEKFHAYIGLGQISNIMEGQKLAYDWLKTEATNKHDQKTLGILEKIGEPPFYHGKQEGRFGDLLNKYPGYNYSDDQTEKASIFSIIKGAFISPDYTLSDIYKVLVSGPKFSLFDSKDLQNKIIRTNFIGRIIEFKTSIYFIQGIHDKVANYDLTKEYFEIIQTTGNKEFISLENSAHYPNKEDFEKFKRELIRIVNS